MLLSNVIHGLTAGADPGFQVRGGGGVGGGGGGGGGAQLKKLHRAEGGAKILGVFRVKNHDFMPKKSFFPILGARAPGALPPPPPWIRLWTVSYLKMKVEIYVTIMI